MLYKSGLRALLHSGKVDCSMLLAITLSIEPRRLSKLDVESLLSKTYVVQNSSSLAFPAIVSSSRIKFITSSTNISLEFQPVAENGMYVGMMWFELS